MRMIYSTCTRTITHGTPWILPQFPMCLRGFHGDDTWNAKLDKEYACLCDKIRVLEAGDVWVEKRDE